MEKSAVVRAMITLQKERKNIDLANERLRDKYLKVTRNKQVQQEENSLLRSLRERLAHYNNQDPNFDRFLYVELEPIIDQLINQYNLE